MTTPNEREEFEMWRADFTAQVEEARKNPTWNCRFHPTNSWHEVGCPHREWSTKEMRDALDLSRACNMVVARQKHQCESQLHAAQRELEEVKKDANWAGGERNAIIDKLNSKVVEQEAELSDLRVKLKRYEDGLQKIVDEITQEINSRPRYANLGKRGCIRRIESLLAALSEGKDK